MNVGRLLVNPIAVYAMQTKLASLIVNFKQSEARGDPNDTDGDDDGEGKNDFENTKMSRK